MNKLSALKKKSAMSNAGVPNGGSMDAIEDLLFGGMADGMTRLGALSSAKTGSDWTSRSVEIIPKVSISAKLPGSPMVEMDGMSLVTEMVKAADMVFPKIAMALQSERANAWKPTRPAHDLLGIDLLSGYSRADIVVAVTRKLLTLQDWAHVPKLNRWRSPMWLYPPIMLKWETLEALVREEVALMEGKALPDFASMPEPDTLPTEE